MAWALKSDDSSGWRTPRTWLWGNLESKRAHTKQDILTKPMWITLGRGGGSWVTYKIKKKKKKKHLLNICTTFNIHVIYKNGLCAVYLFLTLIFLIQDSTQSIAYNLSLAEIGTHDLHGTSLTRYQLSCPDWIHIKLKGYKNN